MVARESRTLSHQLLGVEAVENVRQPPHIIIAMVEVAMAFMWNSGSGVSMRSAGPHRDQPADGRIPAAVVEKIGVGQHAALRPAGGAGRVEQGAFGVGGRMRLLRRRRGAWGRTCGSGLAGASVGLDRSDHPPRMADTRRHAGRSSVRRGAIATAAHISEWPTRYSISAARRSGLIGTTETPSAVQREPVPEEDRAGSPPAGRRACPPPRPPPDRLRLTATSACVRASASVHARRLSGISLGSMP